MGIEIWNNGIITKKFFNTEDQGYPSGININSSINSLSPIANYPVRSDSQIFFQFIPKHTFRANSISIEVVLKEESRTFVCLLYSSDYNGLPYYREFTTKQFSLSTTGLKTITMVDYNTYYNPYKEGNINEFLFEKNKIYWWFCPGSGTSPSIKGITPGACKPLGIISDNEYGNCYTNKITPLATTIQGYFKNFWNLNTGNFILNNSNIPSIILTI